MESDFKVGDLVRLKILVNEDDNVTQNDFGIVVETLRSGYEQRIYVKWQRSGYEGPCRKWWLELVP
jgi:ribosomal protein L19